MPQCDNPNCCLSHSSCCHVGPHSFCDKHKDKEPVPAGMGYGWICPVCGRGMSPYATVCHCKSPPFTVTCSTSWSETMYKNGFMDLDLAHKMMKE